MDFCSVWPAECKPRREGALGPKGAAAGRWCGRIGNGQTLGVYFWDLYDCTLIRAGIYNVSWFNFISYVGITSQSFAFLLSRGRGQRDGEDLDFLFQFVNMVRDSSIVVTDTIAAESTLAI